MAEDYETKMNARLKEAFSEVVTRASSLVETALDDHFADLQSVFLRDKAIAVSLALTIGLDGAGRVEIELNTGYVKERVKDKSRCFVTPGQAKLPGFEAKEELHAGEIDEGEPDDFGTEAVDPPYLDHPFRTLDGTQIIVEAGDRQMRVMEMNADQLRAVLNLPGCQKSVVKAAERRLKKLEKEEAAKNCDNCRHGAGVDVCKLDENEVECSFRDKWQPVEAVA